MKEIRRPFDNTQILPVNSFVMMTKGRYRVYVEKDLETGLFSARCLEMSVFSQGRDEKEALDKIKEAISLHVEVLNEEVSGKKIIEVEV